MKKKLTMMLSVALIAVMAICGTLAYLTSTDSDVNVMTTGNVEIKQNEQERINHKNVEEGLQNFTQGQEIYPAADVDGSKDDITVNGYHLEIREGETYVDKIVSVTNTGKSDAYVRTIFAFPEAGEFDTTTDASEQWLHWNGVSDGDTNPGNGWMWGENQTEWPGNAEGWDVVENVEINGKTYDIYVATNKNALAPDKSTSPSLLGFYLDARVDFDGTDYTFTDKNGKVWNLGDISNLDILVLSQAVQTEGFDNAWEALDEAFGDVTEEKAVEWFGEMEVPVIVSEATDLTAAFANKESVALSGTVDGNELIYPYGENFSMYTAEYYAKSVKSISGGTLVMDNNRYDGLFAFNVGEITNMTINGINRNTLSIQNSNVSTTVENVSVNASGGSAVTVENGIAGVTLNDVIVSQNGVGEGVPIYLNCALFVSANSKVIINDGSYTSETGYAIRTAGSGASVVTINGGTFKGNLYVASQNGDSMIINGGTFSVNPDNVEGITVNGLVVNNSDGTWTVK